MADLYLAEAWAALRAALAADADLVALVPASRIVDEPQPSIALPYVRLGSLEAEPDDTDGTAGHVVTLGLEVHSRPLAGRIECARIIAALEAAVHRRPERLRVTGFRVVDIEALASAIERAADGATYEGRLVLELTLYG